MRYTREDGCRAWLTYGLLQADTVAALLEEYGGAEPLYNRFTREKGGFLRGRVSESALTLLREQATPAKMHQMMLTMQRLQAGIVALKDERYPAMLRTISKPPALLFYCGQLDCLAGKCLTVVGSRNASVHGVEATKRICKELSNAGVVIVSGFAAGIDRAAHCGCLEGASPTVAVLGCGMDVQYPTDSGPLRERILRQGGLLLTEFPFGLRPGKFTFPVRNRILSGLSKGVLMMEGRVQSGSMVTVQFALDQGRDVFAFPGQPDTPFAEGAHQLLREGAIYFTSAQDILEDMGWAGNEPAMSEPAKSKPSKTSSPAKPAASRNDSDKKADAPSVSKPSPKPSPAKPAANSNDSGKTTDAPALPGMSAEQRKVYDLLAQGEMSFDQLCEHADLSAPKLSAALTLLQIAGKVQALPGKSYRRV